MGIVGARTIVTETRQQTTQNEEGRSPHQFSPEAARQRNNEQEDLLNQDDLEYADDANLHIEHDAREQLFERMGNYDISTETRDLKIQWVNVLLRTHAGSEPAEELPPPFDQIMLSTGGIT